MQRMTGEDYQRENKQSIEFLGHHTRTRESYKKGIKAVTRPAAKTRALGIATAASPFEEPWVLLVLLPVWVGVGVRVKLKREDDENGMLLLPGRPKVEEMGGREEGSVGEGSPGVELLSSPSRSIPVPQGILSPFGWAGSLGGVLLPFSSVMTNLVVQYFSVEAGEVNS